MLGADVFRDQPSLTGPTVRLDPTGPQHVPAFWPRAAGGEADRLTGTHAIFTEEQIREWVSTRPEHHDRAIVRRVDGAVLGEAVLNALDPDNGSASFRIALLGPAVFGRGYGSEATRLVVDYGLDVAGLHRISLEVLDVNLRARRVYEKCGFVRDGVLRDALPWRGECHDAIVMSVLATDPGPGRVG